MDTATKVLIVGGLLNLVYGFVTGVFFAAARQTRTYAPRYLVFAHVGPLMQGPMLLSLTIPVAAAGLSSATAILAAMLLVAGSVAIAAKDTANWVLGVEDEFAERPVLPRALAAIGVSCAVAGLAIVVYGVMGTVGRAA